MNQKHPEIPSLTTEQIIEVDRAMMEDYKIELIQMMVLLKFYHNEIRRRLHPSFFGISKISGTSLAHRSLYTYEHNLLRCSF